MFAEKNAKNKAINVYIMNICAYLVMIIFLYKRHRERM